MGGVGGVRARRSGDLGLIEEEGECVRNLNFFEKINELMISKGTPGFGGVRALDISKARPKRAFGAHIGNYGDNPYS